MNRRLLVGSFVALGLSWATFSLVAQSARGGDGKTPDSSSARSNRDESDDASDRIEKTIRDYHSRLGQDVERDRQEIERMRKELRELSDTRFDMLLALTELRADLGSASPASGTPGPGVRVVGGPNGVQPAVAGEAEPKLQRSVILHQEYRQLQDSLRNELNQARGQTDQLVQQLRALRAQQRQLRQSQRTTTRRDADAKPENQKADASRNRGANR